MEHLIYLNPYLVKRLKEVIRSHPELNLSNIINQALEEWLRSPDLTKKSHQAFICEANEGFGPIGKERKGE